MLSMWRGGSLIAHALLPDGRTGAGIAVTEADPEIGVAAPSLLLRRIDGVRYEW
jgi:hypothetical protein